MLGFLCRLWLGKPVPRIDSAKRRGFGDVDRLAVQRRALAALRGEHLVACRIVENADLKLLILAHQRDRNAEHRIAMGKVGRAIEGIDIPAVVGVGTAASAFFADNAVFRPAGAQALDDQLLRSAVGLGHQINVAFVLDSDVAGEVAHEKRAGLAGNRFHLGQVLRHSEPRAELPFFGRAAPSGRGLRAVSSAM